MYKHILLPVDGSDLSLGAVASAVQLAKLCGSALTALTVTAPYRSVAIGELAAYLDQNEYEARTAANAEKLLQRIKAEAANAGISIRAVHVYHPHPWEAIIAEAKDRGADLIVMASHGRRGLAGLLIGSETRKVLTHTNIPVLVWRG